MRLKLPWQRDKGITKVDKQQTLSSTVASFENQSSGHESVRGAEILESGVETVELGALAKLPPFRPIVISLVRLFDRDDVKIEEIAGMVESDPSLASEILAVVNSPLFGFQRPVSSPAHAIALLGVDRTKSLAATLAMRSLMQGGPRTPIVRRFWVHSMATATLASHIAPAFQVEPELAHVAAMMHDLGRNGLLAAHQEEYAQLAVGAFENTKEILAAEQSAFGMTHCHAGAMLAKAWNLPKSFREVTLHHHEASSENPIVDLVHLCCTLADDFMYLSIYRHDVEKPEETIARFAPAHVRDLLTEDLGVVSAAVDTAIKALDF